MRHVYRLLFSIATLISVVQGAEASLQVSPLWVDFYRVEVGGWRSQSVQVMNSGQDVISFVSAQSDCPFDVRAMSYCGGPLNPNQSCTIAIDFQPRRVDRYNCSILVNSSKGDSQRISVFAESYERKAIGDEQIDSRARGD